MCDKLRKIKSTPLKQTVHRKSRVAPAEAINLVFLTLKSEWSASDILNIVQQIFPEIGCKRDSPFVTDKYR
ncbi:hypothetical protein Plhal304r1_c024g0081721 [Plasmopara halstedii]